jgi:tRNA threonylcarbamoyl adenosine modification protein YjeE
MLPSPPGSASFAVALPDEHATRQLMLDVAAALRPGDLVTLSGDLGAGKTTFARALIRHLAGDETIPVPSPSFTLLQTYDLNGWTIAHADLYRLSVPGELAELGFDDLPENALILLEWPDRAAGFLPADRLDIAFTLNPALGLDFRNVRVTGYGSFAARAERVGAIRDFLNQSGYRDAARIPMQGDASTRSYERLVLPDSEVILMNAPRRPDGPPVRNGKPYSTIAHLAEDVKAFVAMANGLRARGFSAPEIRHADLDNGFLALEDLGNEPVVDGEPVKPIEQRYAAAVEFLVELHGRDLPSTLPVAPQIEYALPDYDMDAFLIEAELLIEWYLPLCGMEASAQARETYTGLWRNVLDPVIDRDLTWVLRDFHSPNLLWLADRSGIARIGILDFQDAVVGPAAYDLASLLQDARVDVPEALEIELLGRYARARREINPDFDASGFIKAYVTLAAQRASKILGIFARLDRRDGKPQYLRHLPRIWTYLQRALEHPTLSMLSDWYKVNIPPPPSGRSRP